MILPFEWRDHSSQIQCRTAEEGKHQCDMLLLISSRLISSYFDFVRSLEVGCQYQKFFRTLIV